MSKVSPKHIVSIILAALCLVACGFSVGTNEAFAVSGQEASIARVFSGGESFIRLCGDDRYETAKKVAEAYKQAKNISKFENVVVACGTNYPDALSGVYLAKQKNAPILLVCDCYEEDIANYIKSNLAEDGCIYILGDENVISAEFEELCNEIAVAGKFSVRRLCGLNRYATNQAIMEEVGIDSEDLLICTGNNYADSLSGSAVGLPIILVDTELNDEQREYLATLNPSRIYICGADNAVSESVEAELKEMYTGKTFKRFEGTDRFDTSRQIADEFFDGSVKVMTLARGYNYPDGLTGSSLALALGAPVILTEDWKSPNNISNEAKKFYDSHGVEKIVAYGGDNVLPDKIINYITTGTNIDIVRGEQVVDYAETLIGCPYCYGGNDPVNGFDCAHFVAYVYKNCPLHINISGAGCTNTYASCGGIDIVYSWDLIPGDIIFTGYGTELENMSHVMIYAGDNTVIHAGSDDTGVCRMTLFRSDGSIYSGKNILAIKRII